MPRDRTTRSCLRFPHRLAAPKPWACARRSVSCSNKSSEVIHSKLQVLNSIDSTNHGYNELANPNNIELFAISDFNTDNPDIDNIDRPKTFINTTQIDTNLSTQHTIIR